MTGSIRCMIIEDDELDRLVLQQQIRQFENLVLVGSFEAAEKAVPHLHLPVDLLILDIDLPGMSGIEFRKICQKIPACIFVSSHPEYAIDTFEVDTFDFLTKPLKSERFRYSMQKLFDFFEMKEKSENFDTLIGENVIKIKEGSNISRIKISDILYLEALKDYTRVVTSEKRYCILDSIGSMLNKSDFGSFVRIHRSYAVPRHLIRSRNTHEVELVHQVKLPIGRAYKSNLDFFGT
ncbi:LytTR family DNA-binding domain-containing protein [uncultured Chryseobacterium sp.]|uniref:LytR/AlgR family response regulator transcription factor n=1 Tax=uncultured Chryseobacterium sp. TaxID=259322 RepID=UPI0025FAF8D7|nr:LytTR family DNA-binding domain-containing protein [uncultured Chryseobacterium sp.]